MPEMPPKEDDGNELFKFASPRELYIAAASSALHAGNPRLVYIYSLMFQAKHKLSMLIASSDGNLTRKEMHKTLKAVEVNVHSDILSII